MTLAAGLLDGGDVGGPEITYLTAGVLFPLAAVLLVVAFVVARRRRRGGDDGTSRGMSHPTTDDAAPRTIGGDRVVVFVASNDSLASVVAGALRGADIDATVRSTGAAGYGAREFSVLVPPGQHDHARDVLRDIDGDTA